MQAVNIMCDRVQYSCVQYNYQLSLEMIHYWSDCSHGICWIPHVFVHLFDIARGTQSYSTMRGNSGPCVLSLMMFMMFLEAVLNRLRPTGTRIETIGDHMWKNIGSSDRVHTYNFLPTCAFPQTSYSYMDICMWTLLAAEFLKHQFLKEISVTCDHRSGSATLSFWNHRLQVQASLKKRWMF